jgi:hypothetical protein
MKLDLNDMKNKMEELSNKMKDMEKLIEKYKINKK